MRSAHTDSQTCLHTSSCTHVDESTSRAAQHLPRILGTDPSPDLVPCVGQLLVLGQFFFLTWTIFKVFIGFITVLLLFYVLGFFGPEVCGILVP